MISEKSFYLFSGQLGGRISLVADGKVIADDEVARLVHVAVHPALHADLLLDGVKHL